MVICSPKIFETKIKFGVDRLASDDEVDNPSGGCGLVTWTFKLTSLCVGTYLTLMIWLTVGQIVNVLSTWPINTTLTCTIIHVILIMYLMACQQVAFSSTPYFRNISCLLVCHLFLHTKSKNNYLTRVSRGLVIIHS